MRVRNFIGIHASDAKTQHPRAQAFTAPAPSHTSSHQNTLNTHRMMTAKRPYMRTFPAL